ncbi:MAG: ATP-binding protein [Thiohalomonadales bacterium]
MLIIGTVVAFIGITPLYNRLKVEQSGKLSFTIHTRFMAINQHLTRSIDIAEQVTSRTKIRLKLEAFNRGESTVHEVADFSSKLLEDAMLKSTELVSITRLDRDDRYVLSVGNVLRWEQWVVPEHGSQKAKIKGPVVIDDESFLIVGAPILSRNGERVGTDVVVFSLDSLEKIMLDYTGLGESGDSILVANLDGALSPLFPLRNSSDDQSGSIDPRTPLGMAASMALNNNEGIILPETSTKNNVVFTYRGVPATNWGLIVRMDADELYGQINRQIILVAVIIAILILFATAGLILLLRPLTGKTVIHVDELQREIDIKTRDLLSNQARLERVNRELDQFAYVTSHDLKAPLRAIANLSEWIEEDIGDKLTGETKHQMDLLRKRVFRLQDFIEGILEYARVGREKVTIERIDTAEVIADIVSTLGPPNGYTVHTSAEMPIIATSKVRFTQVMSNLIGNAIKYRDSDSGNVDISVNDAGDCFEFVVSDDGPGISSEYHKKIFVIFQTLQSRDVHESTGIGLTIVKKIVEEEGGRIMLDSEIGKGTVFRFTWPKTANHHIEAA